MTRDLPFDDDETGERGDTAYQVANGVARVARGGAYVTGGALVATNGGGVPAPPGEQHLDSWNAGWARTTDPDPDVPSPVLTFPEPSADDVSGTPEIDRAASAPEPLAPQAPAVDAAMPGLRIGAPPAATDSMVADSGWGYGQLPGSPGYGYGQIPLTPGWESGASGPSTGWGGGDLELPGTGLPNLPSWQAPELPSWWDGIGGVPDEDDPQGGFGLPGHGLGQAGHGFGTGDIGFVAPGADPLGLTRMSDADAVGTQQGEGDAAASDPAGPGNSGRDATFGDTGGSGGIGGGLFDGIGSDPFGVYLGVEAGAEIATHWTIDAGITSEGAYFYSDLRVEASAGARVETAMGTGIGDQLDRFGEWLGTTTPTGTGRPGAEGVVPGAGGSGLSGNLGGPGLGATGSGAAGFVPPPAPLPSAAAPPAPVHPAPVAPAAVPMAVAPAVAAPPVVAATPLQTTIQPDAATTPIANVLAPPPGPSPLTAPAAELPALFPAVVRPPEPQRPLPQDDDATTGIPGTGVPTTVVRTTVPSADAPTPSLRPGGEPSTATNPVLTTVPGVDPTVTRTPPTSDGAAPTTRPGQDATGDAGTPTTTAPAPRPTGNDAPTTRPGGNDAPATRPGGDDAPSRPPVTADQPDVTGRPTSGGDSGGSAPTGGATAPSVDVPTVDVPTQAPTAVRPSTADQPGTVPSVDLPSVQAPVPTGVAPGGPPKPNATGISADGDDHWWHAPVLAGPGAHTLAASEFAPAGGLGYGGLGSGDGLHHLPGEADTTLL